MEWENQRNIEYWLHMVTMCPLRRHTCIISKCKTIIQPKREVFWRSVCFYSIHPCVLVFKYLFMFTSTSRKLYRYPEKKVLWLNSIFWKTFSDWDFTLQIEIKRFIFKNLNMIQSLLLTVQFWQFRFARNF